MHADRDTHTALLRSSDPPPFEYLSGPSADYLIVCDHAGAAIPSSLGTLGLSGAQLATHIAIDIGRAAVQVGSWLASSASTRSGRRFACAARLTSAICNRYRFSYGWLGRKAANSTARIATGQT